MQFVHKSCTNLHNPKFVCPECPGFHDSKTVFRIIKSHQEVGRPSKYVCRPTIPNPQTTLKT